MKNVTIFLITLVLFCTTALFAQHSSTVRKHHPPLPLFSEKGEYHRNSAEQRHFSNRAHLLPWQEREFFHERSAEEIMSSRRMPYFEHDQDSYPLGPYPGLDQFSTSASSIDTAWVRHYGSGLASSSDIANAMVMDGEGNIYVTGGSVTSGTDYDYVTIKYNSDGQEQWVARYNGLKNSKDIATAMAMDSTGNVYVTGSSDGGYTTIKYNSLGEEQWVARSNGPGNFYGEPVALDVNADGNVYIIGRSSGETSTDYGTIKYNAAGEEQWVARYNGPENGTDVPVAMAVDDSDNVYVTGTNDFYHKYDWATIKYNGSGEEQWVARYNGPENGRDEPTALAVDDAGNVYVTGFCYWSYLNYDYITIKYSAEGNRLWFDHYDGDGSTDVANALAIDSGGNVYVTGRSMSKSGFWLIADYTTIKYSNTGRRRWVARYKEGHPNVATHIAVDGAGNVYVTGFSEGSGRDWDYATIKYNSRGQEQWATRYDRKGKDYKEPVGLAVDDAGNVYVTGTSEGPNTGYDYVTIKYSAAGEEQRIVRYNNRTGNDYDVSTSLAVDFAGNVYVTGYSESSDTGRDWATIKYNAAGEEQWIARYNGPGDGDDSATALTIDGTGNVYVTGYTSGSNTGYDYATIKYSAAGEEQWVVRYNGPRNASEHAYALAVDGTGNVYVTGYSSGSGTDYDYATIKYNAAGEEQWVVRYNGPGNGWDWATAVVIDSSGNVYVTGFSKGSGTDWDYATIKYNTAGEEQWVARYNGPENDWDTATALVIDDSDNIYVTGYSGSYPNFDYATIKYNAAGEEQWVTRYNGPGDGDDSATALAVDGTGNVYVTGFSKNSSPDYDYATIKYNTAGEEQWIVRYDGPGNGWDNAFALAVDDSENVYVAGYSSGSGTGEDLTTIKYNTAGEEQWVVRYNGPENAGDHAYALAVDVAGNIYVTGNSSGDGWSRYTTIKYTQMGTPSYPQISLSSNSIVFDSTAVDSTDIKYLTIYNLGNAELSIDSMYTSNPVFQIDSVSHSIASMDSEIVEISFTPEDIGVVNGLLTIMCNDINNPTINVSLTGVGFMVTGISNNSLSGIPERFELYQNYPNPFNPETTIEYQLPKTSQVKLVIYNLAGQRAATLVDDQQPAGFYSVQWNGKDDSGKNVASGVYLYRLETKEFVQVKKLALVR